MLHRGALALLLPLPRTARGSSEASRAVCRSCCCCRHRLLGTFPVSTSSAAVVVGARTPHTLGTALASRRRWPPLCSAADGVRRYASLSVEADPALRDYLARIKSDYARLTAPGGTPTDGRTPLSMVDGGSGDRPRLLSRLTLLARLVDEYEASRQAVAAAAAPADLGGSDDGSGDAAELRQLLEEERQALLAEMRQAEGRLLQALVPPERGDDCSTVLEVTAGVGGQEAMLFSHELFSMYQRYSAYKGWAFELSEFDDSPDLPDSLRKGVAMISGTDVYRHLKFEGGVHRVQRIPVTEKAGRIHTSTVTVSVLPQPADIDVVLDPRHLRIDTFRSSGKGGQHVNKTESAVRITHLPTGTVAECQCERSQIRNRAVAMQVLRSRIFEAQLRQQTDAYNSARRLQVGSASRSEKIRTYNYCQDRVTDHRVKESVHGVERLLAGSDELDAFVERLQEASRSERLVELVRHAGGSGSSAGGAGVAVAR